jgi:hypothetical protein
MYICTFTITSYGTSGNELPPPPERSFSRSVLSGGGDTEESFKQRMQIEGMALRELLTERFAEQPKPYSCADSCSWTISQGCSVSEIVREILRS